MAGGMGAAGALGPQGQDQGQGFPSNPYGGSGGLGDSTNTTTQANMTGGGAGMSGLGGGIFGDYGNPQNPGVPAYPGSSPYQQSNPYQQMQQGLPLQPAQPQQMSNVNDMYTNLLGRQADEGGLKYWQGQVDKGMSLADVQKGFMNSDEYKQKSAVPAYPGQGNQQQMSQSPLNRGYDGNNQQMPQQFSGLMGLLRGIPQFENNPFGGGGGLSGLNSYGGSNYRPNMSAMNTQLKNVAPFYKAPTPVTPDTTAADDADEIAFKAWQRQQYNNSKNQN